MQATWADAKSTGSFYAVTPTQSAVTGLPGFNTNSGLLFGSLGLLRKYYLGFRNQ